MIVAPTTNLALNHILDALRGIFALLVLATHLQSSITGFYPDVWPATHPAGVATFAHGGIGVDVFLLISGFIVTEDELQHVGQGLLLVQRRGGELFLHPQT